MRGKWSGLEHGRIRGLMARRFMRDCGKEELTSESIGDFKGFFCKGNQRDERE